MEHKRVEVISEKKSLVNLLYSALRGFPGGSMVKHLLVTQESGFSPWVGKIPLEEGMATHSTILVWRIPWTEEPGRLHSMGLQRVRYD